MFLQLCSQILILYFYGLLSATSLRSKLTDCSKAMDKVTHYIMKNYTAKKKFDFEKFKTRKSHKVFHIPTIHMFSFPFSSTLLCNFIVVLFPFFFFKVPFYSQANAISYGRCLPIFHVSINKYTQTQYVCICSVESIDGQSIFLSS